MKKAIVILLIALLVHSAGISVFPQTLPGAREKDFPPAYELSVGKTLALRVSTSKMTYQTRSLFEIC